MRGLFNNINDRATFNEVVADLFNNGYIDMEEGDNPDLGENNVRLKLKDDAPEEYKDIFEKLVEAQRRIENAELDTARYFEQIRQRVEGGLDRAGLNQLISDLVGSNIIDLHDGNNPDLGDNNVRFSLKSGAERYQAVFEQLREQQRQIENEELNIPIDFEQEFSAERADNSGSLDDLIYDRYENVFGVTSTFGREDLRPKAAQTVRETIISKFASQRGQGVFQTMGREIEDVITRLRHENGDLQEREDLGMNAAAVRLEPQARNGRNLRHRQYGGYLY